MKKNGIYNNNPPACKYCAKGSPVSTGLVVLCHHAGVCQPDDKCRRFKYDPLKRVPDKNITPLLPEFSQEDFEY